MSVWDGLRGALALGEATSQPPRPSSVRLLTPGVLRVGIWDRFWRRLGRDPDPSITYYQPAPHAYGFEWIDLCDDETTVDVVMGSCEAEKRIAKSRHPRRILYLQETTEAHKPPSARRLKSFDLVLSNDRAVLNAVPDSSRYMTLFGIRMPAEHYAVVPPKAKNISLMGSPQRRLSGHVLRWRVHDEVRGFDAFGFDGQPYWKSSSLASYRFQICSENSNYRDWATEKLWDAFALETVPIYWSGITGEALETLGFRADGVIRWSGNLEELQSIIDGINASPDASYARFRAAAAHNRRRVLELPCGEVALRPVICEYFGFDS